MVSDLLHVIHGVVVTAKMATPAYLDAMQSLESLLKPDISVNDNVGWQVIERLLTNTEVQKCTSHTEAIICPECSFVQDAEVQHTEPFYTYIKKCECCSSFITESDWELVNDAEVKVKERKNKLIAALEWHREKKQEKGYGVAEYDIVIEYLKTGKTDKDENHWGLLRRAVNDYDDLCHEYLNDKQ